MKIDVLNKEGQKTGRAVELPNDVFGIEQPNDHVVYLAVKQFLAAQRQGTHKVKTRAEVQGASRKLHRQKGTGGSRKGNIRNPLYKGGGTIFGPKPRDYSFKLNKKVKDLAKCSAFSYKTKDNALMILEDIKMDTPKTSQFISILDNLKVSDKKVLFLYNEFDESTWLSIRNIPSVLGSLVADVNTYDIMNSDAVIMSESAAKIFSEEPVEA
jgi:large subunit ribosomal protein L4